MPPSPRFPRPPGATPRNGGASALRSKGPSRRHAAPWCPVNGGHETPATADAPDTGDGAQQIARRAQLRAGHRFCPCSRLRGTGRQPQRSPRCHGPGLRQSPGAPARAAGTTSPRGPGGWCAVASAAAEPPNTKGRASGNRPPRMRARRAPLLPVARWPVRRGASRNAPPWQQGRGHGKRPARADARRAPLLPVGSGSAPVRPTDAHPPPVP